MEDRFATEREARDVCSRIIYTHVCVPCELLYYLISQSRIDLFILGCSSRLCTAKRVV